MKLVFSTNTSNTKNRDVLSNNNTDAVYNMNIVDNSVPMSMLASKVLSHVPVSTYTNNRFMHQPNNYTSAANMFSNSKNLFYNNNTFFTTNCKNCGK